MYNRAKQGFVTPPESESRLTMGVRLRNLPEKMSTTLSDSCSSKVLCVAYVVEGS